MARLLYCDNQEYLTVKEYFVIFSSYIQESGRIIWFVSSFLLWPPAARSLQRDLWPWRLSRHQHVDERSLCLFLSSWFIWSQSSNATILSNLRRLRWNWRQHWTQNDLRTETLTGSGPWSFWLQYHTRSCRVRVASRCVNELILRLTSRTVDTLGGVSVLRSG